MPVNFSQMSAGVLSQDLERRFIENTTWPLDQCSLTALVDLGCSDRAIAHYYRVPPADVASLRHTYGLNAAKAAGVE